MARSRIELQALLETILGTRNVYFQPPATIRMSYPCIVYSLTRGLNRYADNIKYRNLRQYSVTVIDRSPTSKIADAIELLDYCELNTTFAHENLNHYVFTLYF